MQWILYIQAAMQALAALSAVDGAASTIIKKVQGTLDAAKADGNRDPTPDERKALDDIIAVEMAKLDA